MSKGILEYAIVTDRTGAAKAAPPGQILAHNTVPPPPRRRSKVPRASGFSPPSRRDYGSFVIAAGGRIWARTTGLFLAPCAGRGDSHNLRIWNFAAPANSASDSHQ